MPIYEYRCQSCGHVTEAFLKTKREADDVRCERCGDRRLERVYLSPAAGVRISESAGDALPCCGEQGGCSNPKRCCENW